MTDIYMDWEFLEDGQSIEPISVGLVADDGREYYAVNADMPMKRIAKHDWLMANVVPRLPRLYGEARMHYAGRRNPLALDRFHPAVKRRGQIAVEVHEFITQEPDPALWAWYAAFDHVCLAWLFGPMAKLPEGIPKRTGDLKQEAVRLGNPRVPEQVGPVHHALHDARHDRDIARFLLEYAASLGGRDV